MKQQDSISIVHNCEFDPYGFCPRCGCEEAECNCPGPWDFFERETEVIVERDFLTMNSLPRQGNRMRKQRVFEHEFNKIDEIKRILPMDDITHVLVKVLPKNANDKNQVYWAANFEMLGSLFELDFGDRGFSTSINKRKSNTKKKIPEAIFKRFDWLDRDGNRVKASNVKMLIYAQYPEMRLSGFKTIEHEIPASLSVNYVKENPEVKRVMVLARTKSAGAIGMIVTPTDELLKQINALPKFMGSRVVRLLLESTNATDELGERLKSVVGRWMPGVRLNKEGATIPFNGTQVCGYTLEHSLGIRPNADKNGDFMGIELKTHTSKKVTLMTPEPDMGEYAEDFKAFMENRGYWDEKSDSFRFTGVHTAGMRCPKTGFTMKVVNYDPDKDLSGQLNKDIHIGLFTDDDVLVAGWSKERILNNWSAKHNETVYVSATRKNTEVPELKSTKHNYEVSFDNEVVWCKRTNPKRLLDAIISGVIIFDPAPKYVPSNPGQSKRRSQWRVKDIYKAIDSLYESVSLVEL